MSHNGKNCGNCDHYFPQAKICRAGPPSAHIVGEDDKGNHMVKSIFPPMAPTGYCGAHKPQLAIARSLDEATRGTPAPQN